MMGFRFYFTLILIRDGDPFHSFFETYLGQRWPDQERAQLLKRTTAYKQNPLLKPVKLAFMMIEKILGGLTLADNIVVVLRKK